MDIETAALSKRVAGKARHCSAPGSGSSLSGPRAYNVTTILPRRLLASMCSDALPISANGQLLTRIVTHMDGVSTQYPRNIGITIPKGF
jgi:hypothetical protein